MSNEPLIKVLIKVFMKCCKFILQQIIDGFEWKLHSLHKINGVVVWSMLGQGVHIYLLKHIFEFLVLGRNSSPIVATFMKAFAPTNKSLGLQGLLVPSRSFICFKLCKLITRVSHFKALCCGVSK